MVSLTEKGKWLKSFFNIFVVIIFFPFIIPHLIVFLFHPKRTIILSDTGTLRNLIFSLIFLKHYRNLFYYRIGNIKYFIKWLLPEERSIHVPVNLKLGRAAHFVHNISSYINAKSIGDYFVCYHHVTIGTNDLESNGKPVLGDKVTAYTGAVIVGNIKIGNNVKIGANTVIMKDVPENSTVVGCPARIIWLNGERVSKLL